MNKTENLINFKLIQKYLNLLLQYEIHCIIFQKDHYSYLTTQTHFELKWLN